MVKDGLDAVGAEMNVKDVAEILWEQIVAKDNEIQESVAKREVSAVDIASYVRQMRIS
jgi:hypothetical protein